MYVMCKSNNDNNSNIIMIMYSNNNIMCNINNINV